MNVPEYANDHTYKVLCGFASSMGIEIIYHDVMPAEVLAFADAADTEAGHKKFIAMPQNDAKILLHGKSPSAVLAHEITHFLIEQYYRDDPVVNQGTTFPLRLMLENDCDRMGLAIYLLAEAIVDERIERLEGDAAENTPVEDKE